MFDLFQTNDIVEKISIETPFDLEHIFTTKLIQVVTVNPIYEEDTLNTSLHWRSHVIRS